MSSQSQAQRRATAIAKHSPKKLYKRNVAMKKLTKKQLHKFASTKEKGLPKKVRKRKR